MAIKKSPTVVADPSQIEIYTSPSSGAALYMTPDGKVFASEEAALAHMVEHAYEIEAATFLTHVRDNAHAYFPSAGERGLSVQLARLRTVVLWYLAWKDGRPLPDPKPRKQPKSQKASAEENPIS